MDRSNHYEAAFEAYLRDARLPYVAVDEAKRTRLDDEPIKSLDFIVHGLQESKLLIDIKGRKYPGGSDEKPNWNWQNWSTAEDISGLERWQERFGPGYQSLLVFAYCLKSTIDLPPGTSDLWHWRGRRYLMRAFPVDLYRQSMRARSSKWGTVFLPGRAFRAGVRPFRDFSHPEVRQAG